MRPTLILPRQSWCWQDVKEMLEFRWVLWMLILRDLKLRYKQTALGVLWVVLQPLLIAVLFACVFGKWLHVSSENVPYLLFAFCGLVPWLVFSQSIQRASLSLVNESQLVQKIYFPRIFLPIAGTLGVILDFLIGMLTFGILLGFYRYPPSGNAIFLPIGILLIFSFSSACNILLSCLSAHYRDFKHLIPFMMQFWMYASPLAYSVASIPLKWQWIFFLNPLTGIIEFFRWSLLGQGNFPLVPFFIACCMTVALLFLSLLLFRKLEWTLTDVI